MGVFLLAIFVVWLGVLPGTSPLRPDAGWPVWTQFVLPVLVVTLYDAGYLISMIRTSMVEVMRQPFIRTAVLKGMCFRHVVAKHALRNALIAPFTVILLQLNYLVSGLVVVETVFAYPGFGRMMLEAALAKDIAVIEAGTLVAVTVTMLTQLFGDLGYMRSIRGSAYERDRPRHRRIGRRGPVADRAGLARIDARRERARCLHARRSATVGAAIVCFWAMLRDTRAVDRALSAERDRPGADRRSLSRLRSTGSASTISGATCSRA